MPHRQYSKEQRTVAKINKTITLPMSLTQAQQFITDPSGFRQWLDQQISQYPELFPAAISAGYALHDILPASQKLAGRRFRRIKLKQADAQGKVQVFSIVSSEVLPYRTGYTNDVEKALYLRRFGVPFWGLTYVFGHDDNYWYRLSASLGRSEIVSTTLKDPTRLPTDGLADEKHVPFNGDTAYLAMTVAQDCVFGISLALQADEAALQTAYGRFQQEAQRLDPHYAPQTVNTDGWRATQKAWRNLFPLIVVLECFLHAWLKIRERCTKQWQSHFAAIQQKVWAVYQATDAASLRQRASELLAWAEHTLSGTALEAIQKLCANTERFMPTFDYPTAYRTSNMLDRHMQPLARWLTMARAFHGDWASAELQSRAWAVCHNFLPYCPRAASSARFKSPVHRLNGYVYHDNWLHNLLISTSAVGCPLNHRKQQN